MNTLKEHWNNIFSSKECEDLGWYEQDFSQTQKFLDLISPRETDTFFIPGAGTSMLVDVLFNKGHRIVLNDISNEALSKLKDRLGEDDRLTWLQHDISKPLPQNVPQADIWVDRAVLHFLLDEADIKGYFDNLRARVTKGGWVLLAQFSTLEKPKCAGLELHRYSVEEMTSRIGSDFDLIKDEEYTYINPFGDPRLYVYALYKRR